MEDREILELLKEGKGFNDIFFKEVLDKKYPELIFYKKDESWKDLYIRMIYYISKLVILNYLLHYIIRSFLKHIFLYCT